MRGGRIGRIRRVRDAVRHGPAYRKAVESAVEAREHACATVIAGLRAAIQGVPFMPVAGLDGSDLPAARGFQAVADPYSDANVYVVPALIPDIAILHVQEADSGGNGRIIGTRFEDVLMAQAARRVVLTAERIIDGAAFVEAPESVAIPSFSSTPSSRRRAAPGPSPARRTTDTTPRIWRTGRRGARSGGGARIHRQPHPGADTGSRVIDSATVVAPWDMMAVAMARPSIPARRSSMAWPRRCRWSPRSWRNACTRRI